MSTIMGNHVQYQPEWVREDFVDFVAEKLHPTWAWKKVKAQLIARKAISDDFIQLQLRPNQNFRHEQAQAGQSLLLTVEIAGVRQQRGYSLVEILDNGDLLIAVKQQGLVSNTVTQLALGTVLEISQAQGEFVLKQHSGTATLFLASGSGITAIYALLKQALTSTSAPVDLLYFNRDNAYHAELEALTVQYPQFKYHPFNTLQNSQHLTESLLQQFVPDYLQRECYACGAHNMMQSVQLLYADHSISHLLKTEFFQIQIDETLEAQPVTFLRAQQEFLADTNLLESVEKAGLKPAHGCRMGICNTCSCTKVQGAVRNVLTGEVDEQSNTQIKLCISQAISPVVINL